MQGAGQNLETAVYLRAARLREDQRDSLVANQVQQVQWRAYAAGFTYRVRRTSGEETRLVDPLAGTTSILDDTDRSALRLQSAAGQRFGPHPDGRWSLQSHESNLWLVDLVEETRTQLTSDGTPDHAYGIARSPLDDTSGWTPAPVRWSPCGRYALTQRVDYRGVRTVPLTESAPPDGGLPRAVTVRDAWPGDEHVPWVELQVVDLHRQAMVATGNPRIPATHSSPLLRADTWWERDGSAVYLLQSTRDWLTLTLYRIDPVSGEGTVLVQEIGERRVRPAQEFHQAPNVRVLTSADGVAAEVVWFSERDGWGHLYLHDAVTGKMIRQITAGPCVVQEIVHIDPEARTLLVSVSGLIADDPYRRTYCRVNLDSGGLERVTDDALNHRPLVPDPAIQPGFIDFASTVDTPPVATVRDWSGQVIMELERADASALIAIGWQAPQRFAATGADGETVIHGTLFLPPDFDPEQRYPVLDHLYPGPQDHRAMPYFGPDEIEPMVALGLVGVTIDGKGTPGRGREFNDASWRNIGGGSGLDDHVAVIRELARTRPWMDLDRVAVYGHSAGGFAATRAMELFPDVFQFGIAAAGRHDGRLVMAMIMEAYDDPADLESWARASAIEPAGDITGKLLLVQGELDHAVSIHHTYRLIDRLIAANRDFDLLVVPGDDHVFSRHGRYVERRQWDWYVRHLLHLEPPAGFAIAD